MYETLPLSFDVIADVLASLLETPTAKSQEEVHDRAKGLLCGERKSFWSAFFGKIIK
jgi:hypothetical protein